MPNHDHGCTCGHDHHDDHPNVTSHDFGAAPRSNHTGDHGALLAISVGNTRTSFCVSADNETSRAQSLPNEPFDHLAAALTKEFAALRAQDADVLIASVNDPVAQRLAAALKKAAASPDAVLLLNRDVPLILRHTLDAQGEETVGQDRLLNAVAAFEVVKQACVVVDAGTAITVDFIDGEGVFHGGAIAPGASIMLRAMHQRTAALPSLDLARPETLAPAASPFGKNTPDAMRTGVIFAARGLVRALTERYAEFYGAYPQILATGGDAQLLFEGDDLIEIIVPDLTLRGVIATHRQWLAACEAQ